MLRWIQTIIAAVFVVLLAAWSYHFLAASNDDTQRQQLDAALRKVESLARDFDALQERHADLQRVHEDLRNTYNEAIAKTAVTELLVEDGTLCVTIRTAEGVDRTIPTPFNPAKEIYVDYVVLDGRLWIRRVFDQDTPPGRGLVIDPTQADVDWSDPRLRHGNAVYRSLSEGRWIVTVTGDGSLGLVKSDDAIPSLSPPPPVRDYEPLEASP